MRVAFVVESGTDVRLVEGLATRLDLTVVGRPVPGGVVLSQPTTARFSYVEGPAGRLAFSRFASGLIQKGGHDVVIVQGYGPAAFMLNLRARAPVVMLICSPAEDYYRCRQAARYPDKPFRLRELAALSILARLNAMVGKRYVALSRHLESVVRTHGARSVEVIPVYGVDPSVFGPSREPRADIRRRIGLPEQAAPVIFFSSRVAPEKDTETLLAAFANLLPRHPRALLVNRSGGWRQFLGLSESAGIRANVDAADAVHPVRELPDWYRAADVCVQASRAEGLGFSVLEAMACGVPVVAARVGGLLETVREGETGFTYQTGDAADLTRAIERALDAETGSAVLTQAATMVGSTYRADVVFDRFVAYLKGLVR